MSTPVDLTWRAVLDVDRIGATRAASADSLPSNGRAAVELAHSCAAISTRRISFLPPGLEVITVMQQGQVFQLKSKSTGAPWAYRYRLGGRGSRRVQRSGFASERAANEALERALERSRREQGLVEAPRLSELVGIYLAQHGGEPETVEKLRWLLGKAVRPFGHRRISKLRPAEIAAWRMTIPAGHRFEATQALRQVLSRAVSWGMIDVNPAKHGIDNPQRRRTEKRPFESWDELHALASVLGPRFGPLVVFAALLSRRGSDSSIRRSIEEVAMWRRARCSRSTNDSRGVR